MADDRTGRTAEPAAQDALELLRQEHREVERLFGLYPRATIAQKDTFFEEITHELDAHAAVFEELFYPALKAEARIFPMALRCLGAERLRDLGERMAARKTALREEMADLAP